MEPCPQCSAANDDDAAVCAGCGAALGGVWLGRELPGGYVVQRLLGSGSFGSVYLADQAVLRRAVAVKVLRRAYARDPLTKARFMREARAASRLNHPHSISVFAFGETDEGIPYIVTELLRGKELFKILAEEGALPLRRSVELTLQLLDAVGEAHRLGIVHRDLKPENVLIEDRRGGEFVKVVDYGLARSIDASDRITRTGQIAGTPSYMSPEQIMARDIDERSDLYSIGVILHEMLCGRPPFEAGSATDVMIRHCQDAPPDVREMAPARGIPEAIARLILRALSKRPEDRPASAEVFADELRRASEDTPSVALGACPVCGVKVSRASRFCGDCGAPVSARPTMPVQVQAARTLERNKSLGREAELEWALAGEGVRRVVGEPGIGKTRLLGEVAKSARERGLWVAETAADPWRARVAGHAARTLLTSLGAAASAERAGPRVWAEAIEAAIRAKGDDPGLVSIDDVDLVDPASHDALATVIPRLADLPVRWVLASGPKDKPLVDGETSRELDPIRDPVGREDSEPLAPFWIDQALRLSVERPGAPAARPGDRLAMRLELLGAEARRALQATAVVGLATREQLRVIVSDVRDLERALQVLLAGAWVVQKDDQLRVAHALIEDAVRSSTPAEVSRELNARAAGRNAPGEVLARHAIAAGDLSMGLHLLDAMGAAALAVGDVKGAVLAYQTGHAAARGHFQREGTASELTTFSQKLASSLNDASRWADADGVATEGLDLPLERPADRARLLYERARAAQGRGRRDDAARLLAEAMRLAESSGDDELHGRLLVGASSDYGPLL